MPPLEREELTEALLKGIDRNQDPHLYNDTLKAFENASHDQLSAWYNQQNDPGQAKENAWSASVEAGKRSLSENALPEMSDAAKDAVMKELSNDLESLDKALTHDQNLTQGQQHEHEHDR